MIRVTPTQIVSFCNGYQGLEDVELEHKRGMMAAELYALLMSRADAYRVRLKSLGKERQKILKAQAVADRNGNIKYGESPSGLAKDRPVLWKDEPRAAEAFEALDEKVEQAASTLIDVDADPLPDDFFEKPDALKIKQSVRTAFLPFMAKYQGTANPQKGKSMKRHR